MLIIQDMLVQLENVHVFYGIKKRGLIQHLML